MATHRFTDIPADALAVIEEHTGPVLKAESVSTGLNSEIAARIHTDSGALFVKGLRLEHPRVWTQQREAAIAPYVAPLTPALQWHTQKSGWDLLGFEDVDGLHADYAPSSLHLALVANAMQTLTAVPLPDLPLKTMPERLRAYVGDDAERFAGDQLLHTDWNLHNVLVVDDRARLVDWAWAARGAGWIDPALWVIWLIASGHTADQAERMTRWHTALADAPTVSLDTFVLAQHRLWDEIAGDTPDTWTATMQTAAATWHQHRHG
ncbi:aminoglycoside phosphotransferase [Actinacidiphila glaucinigra]|uniref:aminoglycoside phosphotransferase n=1 Tax=Actinacidiphila glaucinigra TaxID=235986 RepID=UPI0035E3AD8A